MLPIVDRNTAWLRSPMSIVWSAIVLTMVIAVSACGDQSTVSPTSSVAASTSTSAITTPVQPLPTTTVEVATTPHTPVVGLAGAPMIARGSFDYAQESGYHGAEVVHFDVHVVDANDDGFDDLMLTPMLLESVAKPVLHVFDPDSGRFVVDHQFLSVAPAMQHSRELAMVDVDGDGRRDLFFANHGYDDAPWGEPNALLLNTTEGFVDASDRLPQVNDYTHGVIVADLFGDGYDDLVLLNSFNINPETKCARHPDIPSLACGAGPQEGNSYVLSNNGSGVLERTTIDADLNMGPSGQPRLSKGGESDLNLDGVPDLVVTYIGHVDVLESSAVGVYQTAARFDPTIAGCSGEQAFGDVRFADLDDDGVDEVLTYETCDWNEMRWRVFDRSPMGEWTDITETVFPDQSANAGSERKRWCLDLWTVDLDADGDDDIVCDSRAGRSNAFWTRSDGVFSSRRFDAVDQAEPREGSTLVVRLGDETHVVSVAGFRIRSWRVE